MDPHAQNNTPQFAFIDDGVVVPGTGGTNCRLHCYGPDGYCFNWNGGLHPWGFGAMVRNEIWSPLVAIPPETFDQVVYEFDVYRHNREDRWEGMIHYLWRIRSTDDPQGVWGWSEWRNRGEWGWGEPEYYRHHEPVSDLLEPDCKWIQLALGAYDLYYECGWCGVPEPTPAPYFDNVALSLVSGLAEASAPESLLWLDDPSPNPFNPSTLISFILPEDGPAKLSVYDLRGQLVRRLLDESKRAGIHTVQWDGRDEQGASAATGSYLFRLEAGGKMITKKGILLK